MTQIDPNYFDLPIEKTVNLQRTEEAKQETISPTESGVSSIEKSKKVVIPPMILPPFPILQMPMQDEAFSLAINSLANSSTTDVQHFLLSQQLKLQEITNELLADWGENIEKIAEETRRIIQSPQYQAMLDIQLHGDKSLSSLAILESINRTQAFERVTPTDKVSEATTGGTLPTITMPFLSVLFAGGALVAGAVNISAAGLSSPLTGTIELVESLQAVLPQLTADMVPLINLLVMPLIYYTSWDQAIGSLQKKEGQNNQEMIQDFAKQVIRLVGNSDFIMANIVNKMNQAEKMGQEAKEQAAALIKLILASVALSLLYSQDVGKVQGQKFWGMEPQEFQGLLTGQITLPDRSQATSQERLMKTLIELIKGQLDILPAHIKSQIMTILFDYLSDSRKLQDTLDPYKVFNEVLSNSQFNSNLAGFERTPT